MGWSPVASNDVITESYSHSLPAPCIAITPVIRLSDRWCNPSKTFRIYPVTTQILMTYRSTDCVTALYIIPRARTVSPVFVSTLTIIPHRLCAFLGFWYTDGQSLLLYAIVRPRYGKASGGGRASTFIWNENLIALMQSCRVLRRCRHSYPWLQAVSLCTVSSVTSPFTATSSSWLVEITKIINAWILYNYYFGVLLYNNCMMIQLL